MKQLTPYQVFTLKHQSSFGDDKLRYRSYIHFFIEPEVVEKIFAFMEVDSTIWVSFHFPGDLVWSSIPDTTKNIPLTYENKRACNTWSRQLSGIPILDDDQETLPSFVCGWLICREFGTGEADQILLKYLQKYVKI